jgi:hypothetical protein
MTKNLVRSVLTCLLIGAGTTTSLSDARVWHTSDGKQTVRAEAVDAKYDRQSKTTLIYLKRPDGTTTTIPFEKLDAQGRESAWYNVQRRRASGAARPFALPAPGTVKFAERLAPVDAEDVPDSAIRKGDNLLLAIAPRIHELGRPPEGWCGETAIQEALLYYGIYCPQERINEAGKPLHPDLYSNDIPEALKNLGMEQRQWPGGAADLDDFLGWIHKQVAAGWPVLVGVKIYPTQHEEWGLDHFVLAVGVEGDSLVMNTTWGFRYTLSRRQLRSTERGFSFANRYDSYYGISIKGPQRLGDGDRPIRVFVEKETADRIAVIVKCEGLQRGADYSLYKLSSVEEKRPKPLVTFQAKQRTYAVHDTIERDTPAIYRCQKATKER